MKTLTKELQKYCIEALELTNEDYRTHRMFETSEGYPIVFLFQREFSMDYYLCVTNVENPRFEKVAVHKNENHHQMRVRNLRYILGEEILFQLIKQGLFFNDRKNKRCNDSAIMSFIRSNNENDNSSCQIHRFVSLFRFPKLSMHGIEAHHIDINPTNNKQENIIPISPIEHTGEENSIHFLGGVFRSDEEVIKLGSEYAKDFIKRYALKFPCKENSKDKSNE